MTDKHTKDSKGSEHASRSHGKHESHKTHEHSKSHDHAKHEHSDHASEKHAKHEAPKHEKSEAKVSHVSRSEPAAADQGTSPWLVVSVVLGILLMGSIATGGYSDLPDWSPGFNTADQRSSGEFNLDGAYAKGSESAEVTIIEYSDFECPFCARFYSDTLPQIEENYIETGKVKFVYKHFPLSIHPNADDAAEATECAGAQGAFYDMHDRLFDEQSSWARESNPTDTFVGYAEDIGLDTNEFRSCLESGEYADKVQADFQEGSEAGVRGTPAFFINGRMLSGAQPYAAFEEAIEAALAGEAPAPEPTQPSAPEPSSDPELVAIDDGDKPVLGDADAPVQVIEFSDFQCPYCQRWYDNEKSAIDALVEDGTVNFVYRHFPLEQLGHPQAEEAGLATECAGEQDAFYEMHDAIFESSSWKTSDPLPAFEELAADIGIDADAFSACYEDGTLSEQVDQDFEDGNAAGVSGTPSFFVLGSADTADTDALIDAQVLSQRGYLIRYVETEDGRVGARVVGAQPASVIEDIVSSLNG